MSNRLIDYVYIFLTMGLTVYGQLIVKWRIAKFGAMPSEFHEKLKFLLSASLDPYIFSMFVAAFLAAVAWMVAMTKFELSYAFPITSLNFVIVVVLSNYLLNEPVSLQKLVGLAFIVFGVTVASRA